MDKLELNQLKGYLGTGLNLIARNVISNSPKFIYSKLTPMNIMSLVEGDTLYKPILRPLSDLTKEIEVNVEKFVPIEELCKIHEIEYVDGLFNDYYTSSFSVEWLPYEVVKNLYEWHFDLHSLIEKGLAIDINTIKS